VHLFWKSNVRRNIKNLQQNQVLFVMHWVGTAKRVAYHEVGHQIVDYALRRKIAECKIFFDTQKNEWSGQASPTGGACTSYQDYLTAAAIFYAGRSAVKYAIERGVLSRPPNGVEANDGDFGFLGSVETSDESLVDYCAQKCAQIHNCTSKNFKNKAERKADEIVGKYFTVINRISYGIKEEETILGEKIKNNFDYYEKIKDIYMSVAKSQKFQKILLKIYSGRIEHNNFIDFLEKCHFCLDEKKWHFGWVGIEKEVLTLKLSSIFLEKNVGERQFTHFLFTTCSHELIHLSQQMMEDALDKENIHKSKKGWAWIKSCFSWLPFMLKIEAHAHLFGSRITACIMLLLSSAFSLAIYYIFTGNSVLILLFSMAAALSLLIFTRYYKVSLR